jgi:predicted HTH domain antitoxin
VNLQLGAEQHDRLAAAARLFAMRPSTLARMLRMRGVDRARYGERRDP